MIGSWNDYPAVSPYLTCGWPTEEAFLESVQGLAEAGCPFYEVGFPFSDPIADGPVIQESSSQALESGMSLDRCIELTWKATQQTGCHPICMTYANLIFCQGLDSFCAKIAAAGCVGLIVPDLSYEESEPVAKACADHGLDLVSFLAPTSAPERRREIASQARGFLYLVAVRGVTGGATQMNEELSQLVAQAKTDCRVPVLVGFGVRGADQVSDMLKAGADGVFVGTALIEEVGKARDQGRPIKETVRDFLKPMVQACRATI